MTQVKLIEPAKLIENSVTKLDLPSKIPIRPDRTSISSTKVDSRNMPRVAADNFRGSQSYELLISKVKSETNFLSSKLPRAPSDKPKFIPV